MAAGTNGYVATVNEKSAIKVGTSSKGGDMTITVPAGATSLEFYAAAWSGVTGLSLNITPATNVNPTSVSLTADTGISGNSPFTLSGTESSYKFTIALSNVTAETTLKLTSSAAKRFVVWGATYTSGGGGSSSVNYNINIADDITNGTVTASPTSATEGTTVTLTATPDDGYEFSSWNVTNASTKEAITVTDNQSTMPAANVNVSATFNPSQGEGGNIGLTYKKITKQEDIEEGGVYLIVCENENTAMGSQSSNRRNNANVTISNNTISLTSANTDGYPFEVTLETKTGTNNFLLKLSNGNYLGNGAASSNYLKEYNSVQQNGGTDWTINLASSGNVTMKTGHETARILCVNTDNTDSYATYTSDGSYKKVTLYKKVEGPAEISNFIKTSSANLYVGDEIDDLKTFLNLPNDYAGTVTFSSTSEDVEIDGNYLLATGAGEATINVTAAANGNYLETTGTITLKISKKTPVIAWVANTKETYTVFNVSSNKFTAPTAYLTTAGPVINYSVSGDENDVTIDAESGELIWLNAGTYTVTASTVETDAYNASAPITYTINVVDPVITMTPESGTVSSENPTVTFTGNGVKIDYINESEKSGEAVGTTISAEASATETYYVGITDDASNTFNEGFDVYFLQDAGLQFSATELRILVGSEDFV